MGCSFTGHRIIENRHRANIMEAVSRAIDSAYEAGCRDFFSGAAIGFDTLAALEVVKFRTTHPDARLVLLIPCRDQDALWNDAQKREYKRILSLADEVIYISDTNYYNGCMQKRNSALVERCRILIAYVGRTSGGSYQTYKMAQRAGKIIHNIYPELS